MHLVGNVLATKTFARPLKLSVHDAIRNFQARDMLAAYSIDVGWRRKRSLRIKHSPGKFKPCGSIFTVSGNTALGITRKVEVGIDRHTLGG